jgi:hypothetical protein
MFANVQENDFYCLSASVPLQLHPLIASQRRGEVVTSLRRWSPKQLSDALNIFLSSMVI